MIGSASASLDLFYMVLYTCTVHADVIAKQGPNKQCLWLVGLTFEQMVAHFHLATCFEVLVA